MADSDKRRSELAGYSASHRAYEICVSLFALALFVWLLVRLARSPAISGWWVPLALFLGILAADFVSGVAHWGFDSWGNLDTPVLGRLAIRTFREHHVDQKAICGHDFIETNGHNMTLAVIPFGLVAAQSETSSWLGALVATSLLSWGVFVSITSQIHKWAHMAEPPRPVALLQRAGIFLRAEHHDVHHAAPFDESYCITCGWLNGPLRAIGYFRGMERAITWLTGVKPRKDDLDVTGNALAAPVTRRSRGGHAKSRAASARRWCAGSPHSERVTRPRRM